MKLIYFLFLFIVSSLVHSVYGQNADIDNIKELIDYNIIENPASVNIAFINQVGNENMATTIQEQDGILSNYYQLNQSGFGNSGYIKQTGAAHVTQLTQNGQNNEANSWSVGNSTYSRIVQDGNNNTINSYIDNQGFLPKEAMLQQNGNNNSIDIALLGNGFWNESFPKAAVITQTGNELQVSAVLDSYNSPILIEQQSGSNGGGMKIEISNSAFNFPMK